MADKQMFKALVMVELLDSEKEEETKGFKEFKEMMRIDFKHFNEILNLIAPDITPQEIIGGNIISNNFTCRTLDCDT